MNIHTRLIFISIILFACNNKPSIEDSEKRNENWCWFVDKATGNGSWIPVGFENTVRNGNYTLFYKNGEVLEKGKLLDGENVDTIFFYNTNNKIIKYSVPFGDTLNSTFLLEGDFKQCNSKYKILEEGKVKNKKRIGIWKSYFDSGKLKKMAAFKDGSLNGIYIDWNENGEIHEKSFWRNGTLDSLLVLYYDKGIIKEKSFWKEGKKNGESIAWYENGFIKYKINFLKDKKNGRFEYYHKNGVLNQVGTFVNNELSAELKFYDEKGNLFQIDTYENGTLMKIKKI